MRLTDFLEDIYVPLKLRGGSTNTLRLYRHSIKRFSDYLNRDAMLSDFDDLVVSRYLANLAGLSPYSIEKERAQLCAMWNFAARKGIVSKFPTVYPTKLPERLPLAWEQTDLSQLLESCAKEKGEIAGVSAALWWVTLHLVMWDTGERIGAILKLKWDNLHGNRLMVPAEIRKGKTRDRLFELDARTVNQMRSIDQPNRSLIFPWHQAPNHIYYHYSRILRRAGLPTDCKSKFHRMRKTVATFFAAAGGDASKLLDHQNPKTTQRYLDQRMLPETQAKDLLFRIF